LAHNTLGIVANKLLSINNQLVFVFSLSTTSTTTTTKIFFQSVTLYFHYLKRRRQINACTSASLSIRSFYVPYGLEGTPHNEKSTKSGITLRISDLAQFLTLAVIIDASHPQLVLTAAVASIVDDEEATVMSMLNVLDWVYDRQPTY